MAKEVSSACVQLVYAFISDFGNYSAILIFKPNVDYLRQYNILLVLIEIMFLRQEV